MRLSQRLEMEVEDLEHLHRSQYWMYVEDSSNVVAGADRGNRVLLAYQLETSSLW